MKRRDILKTSAIFLGYAVTGGAAAAVLNGCKVDTNEDNWMPVLFDENQMAMLEAAVETIIPTTDTPGASQALVHRYIDEAVSNNFKAEEKQKFINGLVSLDEAAQRSGGTTFAALDQDGRDKAMSALAKQWKATDDEEHIFKVLRDLTVTGYFTSEIGATQALIYDPVPGPYQGCIAVEDVGGTYAL